MTDEQPECDICGSPATPGGIPGASEVDTACPACEDLHRSGISMSSPDPKRAEPTSYPPHGNTTR